MTCPLNQGKIPAGANGRHELGPLRFPAAGNRETFGFSCRLRYALSMKFKVEVDREDDGRWIAEVNELPGVLVYGDSVEQARAKAQALALRVLADRLENGEALPFESVSFAAA
jgi:predicted RNase H-like HicB family nuclease